MYVIYIYMYIYILYIYIYMCVIYIYVSTYTYIYKQMYTYICTYIYMIYTQMYTYMWIQMIHKHERPQQEHHYDSFLVRMRTDFLWYKATPQVYIQCSIYTYIYIHIYIYIYIYTYTHIDIVKILIIFMIFDKFVQLLSHSVTTVTWKFLTENSVLHDGSWFTLCIVNRPIVLGPITSVKTCVFVETVVWTVNRPNASGYEGSQCSSNGFHIIT